jgi:hypothetical protein
MQANKALQAAFHPLGKDVLPFDAASVGATAALLLADTATDDANGSRRIVIVNTHATQDLALFFVLRGQAAAAQVVTTPGGLVVLARTSREVVITFRRRVLIVGSGAATTYNGFADDL